MSKIYNGALELVGNTPLVEVKNIEEELGLEEIGRASCRERV